MKKIKKFLKEIWISWGGFILYALAEILLVGIILFLIGGPRVYF